MTKFLAKFAKKFHYGQKGFTLIELLIVVAVLGVLAAVAIPNIAGFITQGHVAALNSELASVQTAVQGYFAQEGNIAGSSDNTDLEAEGYLSLSAGSLKATYTWDANGIVVGSAPIYSDVEWDLTNGKWAKEE